MTTPEEFVSALAGVTIPGVKRKFDATPSQLSTADLPATYPRLPRVEERGLTADGQGGWPTFTGELIIVIEPMGQNRASNNFKVSLKMETEVITALRTTQLAKSKNRLEPLERTGVSVGDTDYWALLARVSASG